MALTIFTDSTTTRSTRSTITKSSKTTTATSTTTTKTTTRNTTRKTSSTTTKSKLTAQPLANNEKENVNPFTGVNSGPKKQVKAAFGQSSKANTTVIKEDQPLNAANVKMARPQTRSVTSPAREEKKSGLESLSGPSTADTATVPKRRSRKSVAKSTTAALGDVIDLPPLDDTLAGRLLASRRLETDADRRARELTVRPLADLSEAFNLSTDSIRPSEIEVVVNSLPEEEEMHEHKVVPSDLTAALRLLIASDESARLPSVVRKRGVKRTLSSRTSDPTPLRTRAASTSGTPAPRPTKRLRTAQSQSSLSSQEEIEQISYPIVPPNSPARSRGSTLPSLENIPSVFAKDDTSDVRGENEEWLNEYTQTSLFENTQGSSHFSGLGRNSYGRSRESLSFDFSFSSQL